MGAQGVHQHEKDFPKNQGRSGNGTLSAQGLEKQKKITEEVLKITVFGNMWNNLPPLKPDQRLVMYRLVRVSADSVSGIENSRDVRDTPICFDPVILKNISRRNRQQRLEKGEKNA
jgi:hypothetical protein